MEKTPISDFITEYAASDFVRLHMPGHKGQVFLGCEARDITEIAGADALYEASGIIAESEAVATKLFGTGKTLFGTEGSSQCVRAMLELALRHWKEKERFLTEGRPVVVAARNVHKAFLYAAVLLDFEIVWIWPKQQDSLCSCSVEAEELKQILNEQGEKVAAVYVTSPNYLGGSVDVKALASVCHECNTLLLVDNAHGAYLHFLEPSLHPMDLGADLCCDSAHKTLPVLTGGAYLHLNQYMADAMGSQAKAAMELFGSTSPSYLILQSLDMCNRYLSKGYRERLEDVCRKLKLLRERIRAAGWQVEDTDPLKITIRLPEGIRGAKLAETLRESYIECEYADMDFLVFMATPENGPEDFVRLCNALGKNERRYVERTVPLLRDIKTVMPAREAYFSKGTVIPVAFSEGKICRMPMAACPPAIPVVVPGEQITQSALECMKYYGIEEIDVMSE